MPRGRPRKNINSFDDNNHLNVSKYQKPLQRKKRLKAVFVDMVTAFDSDAGCSIEMNIYRIQPFNKKGALDENYEEYTYVGFDSNFIDNLDKGIIPTPIGSAEIVEYDPDGDDDENIYY